MFFLLNFLNAEPFTFQCRNYFICTGTVRDLITTILKALQVSGKTLVFQGQQTCFQFPVFPRSESIYFPLPSNYKIKGNALNASCTKSAAYLFPEERTYLVTDYPVEYTPCLLSFELIPVQFTGVPEGLDNTFFRYFTYKDAMSSFAKVQLFCNMPCYRLSFPVRVGCQIYLLFFSGGSAKFLQYLALTLYNLIVRLKSVAYIDPDLVMGLIGQINDVTHGSFHLVILTQVFAYRTGL